MKMKKSISILCLGFLVTGCAGIKKLPDGSYLSATTIYGDTLDRSATFYQLLEKKGDTFVQKSGGSKLVVGNTLPGDIIRSAVAGAVSSVAPAVIQMHTLKKVAKIRSKPVCPPGTKNCMSTVIGVRSGDSVSVSNSNSKSSAGSDVEIKSKDW